MIVSYYDAVKEIVGIDNMIGGNINGPISNIEFIEGFTDLPTEEQIQSKMSELQAAEPMRLLRLERNRKITETDWWVLPDRTTSQAQKDYRQALRDLPSTAEPQLDEQGKLTNVTWPTKPE